MLKYTWLILKLGLYLLFVFPKVIYYKLRKDKIPYEKRYKFGRRLIKVVDKGLSIDFKVEGKENIPTSGNVLYLANHQSNFDPLLLIDLFEDPTTFVAKVETKKLFFVGPIAEFINVLFMDRKDLRQSLKIMKEVARRLDEEKARVVIFPEGTRTRDPLKKLNEFKPGAIHAAYSAKSTIVPIALFGTYKPLAARIFQRRYRVDVKFLKPIQYEEYKDKPSTELIKDIQALVEHETNILKLYQKDIVKKLESSN